MNLLPWLYLIEHRLSNLKSFEKLQLYLIPLCLMGIIFYNDTPLQANIQHKTNTTLQNHKVETYVFIKAFENQSKALNLTLLSLQEQSSGFAFELQGEFTSLMQMVLFCETFGSINNMPDMKIQPFNDEQYSLKLQLEFATKKYFPQDKEPLQSTIVHLKNPFSEKEKLPSLKLYAIVNDEVLINHEWIHLHEHIREYTLIKIEEQAVVLQNHLGQKIYLEL
ncbi:hypothetical protein [Candidatus Marinarcus aquaticus]|uniref:Uncharacterized protein n=1 Tax=Candidatus Marinarcus aquaticus TaxID=2044504 RepID=A0A4Q0XN16_9BACT|nr:hypothetical protein [Candidatus Marinarcus aquaticus]RXJ54570.1 hypothetical protein CRV04_11070 [Candidatus Marinarcus aquaticus]